MNRTRVNTSYLRARRKETGMMTLIGYDYEWTRHPMPCGFGDLVRKAPYLSGGVIMLIGVYLGINGLVHLLG